MQLVIGLRLHLLSPSAKVGKQISVGQVRALRCY